MCADQELRNVLADWEIDVDYFSRVVDDNPSLRGMILGYVAERKLRDLFASDGRVSSLQKDDDHDRSKKGDLTFVYRDRLFRVESKALQSTKMRIWDDSEDCWVPNYVMRNRKRVKNPHYSNVAERGRLDRKYAGEVQCDASDRREVLLPNGRKVLTTSLVVGEFDILAAGLFSFRGKWDIAFCLNENLPRSTSSKYDPEDRQYLLKTAVPVSWPVEAPFVLDPFLLLDEIMAR